MKTYSELNSKSCFSFLQAASHPEELVAQAHRLSYHSLSLTDYHGFYGMVRAYQKAKELSFKVNFGTEILLENSALCLLAPDIQAYRKICRLLSEAAEGQEKAKPVFNRQLLEKWVFGSNIFLFLAPRQFPKPELFHWLQKNHPLHQFVTKNFNPDLDHQMKEQLKFIPKEVPKVWTWDAFYHESSRFELFQCLQSIRSNIPLSQLKLNFNSENYLKPLELLDRYQVPEEWIKKGNEIAEACSFSPSEIKYFYPKEWLPPGKKSFEFLKELCQEGLRKRFPNGADNKILYQLQYELKLIQELQYEDYFLTVWDIVRFARSQNILCQGRGSAANSVVCYLLEVTSINPVQMNLLFERFISKERNEAPDIDIDFEHERREEVIQYVYKKYGRHRAGMVATLMTYHTKGALRDLGKALEIDSKLIDKLSKEVRWRENIFNKKEYQSTSLQRLFRLVHQLRGFPRHLGQHTGGMILCEDRLDEISPIEPASMPGRSLVQWDKYDIEKLGLLKIDILALGMLTCLRKNFDLLRQHKIADLTLHSIPAEDSKTYQMISESRTVGVFQIESRAQMSMLPRLRPRTFYDLVVEVAIVRPGPIQGGMVHPYLRRRMGLEKIEYAHPLLKPILEKTLGVPIFQEQVMKMAIEVAGYSPGEADSLRRAMGAWKQKGDLKSFASDISKRLQAKNIPSEFAERICKQILGFGEYGFPESHAASFALLTYASAYLKAHYPAAFLCSLLNSMPMGFYPFHVLNSSFMQEGLSVLPVSLEKSTWDHTLELENQEWMLRLGFRCVKNLQKEHVEDFVLQREAKNPRAFDVFEKEERTSLAMLQETQKRLHYWKSLLKNDNGLKFNSEREIQFKEPDPLQSMIFDFEFFQTSLKEHPAALVRRLYWNYSLSKDKLHLSKDLIQARNSQMIFSFGMIQIIQQPPTAKGMCFITMEDETGFFNLVFTPQTWKKYKHLIQGRWTILTYGKLQKNGAHHSILVRQVMPSAHHEAQILSFEDRNKKLLGSGQPKDGWQKQLEVPMRLFNGY